MLTRTEQSNYVCWRGGWEDADSRIRLHFHTFEDGDQVVSQLEISAVGIGPIMLIEPEDDLPCDF